MSSSSKITLDLDYPLAKGGFSRVYRGRYNGNQVVIKVIKNNIPSYSLELNILEEHYNKYLATACKVVSLKTDIYIIMRPAQGNLRLYLKYHHLSNNSKYRGLLSVCKGLKYLHDRDILHLDIKPTNILVYDDCWKLSDFSLACTNETKGQRLSCTKSYRPPEAWRKGVILTKDIDIWSLGCTIYETIKEQVLFNPSGKENDTALMKTIQEFDKDLEVVPTERMLVRENRINIDETITIIKGILL